MPLNRMGGKKAKQHKSFSDLSIFFNHNHRYHASVYIMKLHPRSRGLREVGQWKGGRAGAYTLA